eukprot:TRINITY_DN13912_c0_g1_i1.p1 TRINITY_DN13912_c0_g1~~TRINITY_DN13912_c0_g1_i1.p1  ORF type:complete len:174 (-),score=47.57 TRINITY_DN13912_c0_g1_i1:60-581(-)
MSKTLKGNRLEIEGYTGKNSGDRVSIEVTPEDLGGTDGLKATILVLKCKFAVVQIKVPKIKQLNIANCNRIGVVFDTAVVGVDVTNSQSVDIQGTGKFYNCDIDKSESIKLYSAKDNADNLTILTNGCYQPTIVIFIGKEDEDPIEGVIPCQFKSQFKDGKWETAPVEHENND